MKVSRHNIVAMFYPNNACHCFTIYSNKDVEMTEERTPLKFKSQTVDLDSPPVKKARQQKSRRILDDSSDEENNREDCSSTEQNGHVNKQEQGTQRQEDAAAKENGEIDAEKEERKFIEVMSPQNEKTLIPKRKTGL